MNKRLTSLKNAISLFVFLLIVWGFYRRIFELPAEGSAQFLDEFVIKPIVWLLPVFYFVRREKLGLKSIGITWENLFPAVYFSIALGLIFAIEGVIVNYIKYGGLSFKANIGTDFILTSLVVSFATAISEEITFRGYIFSRMWEGLNNELTANIVTSIGWAIIHMPIVIFTLKLDLQQAIVYLFLTFIFGVGASFVYARTKNVFSSVVLHVLWQWPIILFR